jgi:hypothetical protein
MNFEEWFLSEFSQYGFSLSPVMYNPFNFVPYKAVMVADGCGLRKTSIKITPELSDDLRGWAVPHDHHVEGLRELVRMEMRRQYGHLLGVDFKPTKIIPKLNFI